MILRRSFLKYLLAPLLAPLVRFLPKREEPFLPAGVRVEGPRGVHFMFCSEDIRKGEWVAVDDDAYVVPYKASRVFPVVGRALTDASPGELFPVSIGP